MTPKSDNGWIKLHRSLLEWEWYSDVNVFRLFTHMLLIANHEQKPWRGIEIPKGSFISSIGHLAKGTTLSEREIRTAITKLKTTGELTSHSTNTFTMFSITNWHLYQSSDKPKGKQATGERQATDKQPTTTKELEELKNIPPSGISEEAWHEFMMLRQRMKAADTAYAIKLVIAQLRNLEAQGFRPQDVIEQSLRSGWKDVYPIKKSSTPKPEQPRRNVTVV